jgi:hypothetical protein
MDGNFEAEVCIRTPKGEDYNRNWESKGRARLCTELWELTRVSSSLSISFLCSVSLQPHQLKCCCRFILPFSNNSIISPLGFYHKKLLNRGPSAHPVRIWGLEREKVYFHCIISKRPPLNSRIKKLFHSSLLCLLCVCVCVCLFSKCLYEAEDSTQSERGVSLHEEETR